MILRLALALLSGLAMQAQEQPLRSLPYTPSLETKFIDRTADPCVNFFQFACGNWNQMNPIPPDQPRWDVYAKLTTENQRFLWGLLEEAAKPSATRTPNQQKIGDFFSACMDEVAVEKAGAAPLKKDLDAISTLRRVADLPALLARFHLQQMGSPLFEFGSGQDYGDSSRVIAFASAGGLGLPDRDYYVNEDAKSKETRERYVDHVTAMFRLLGESGPYAAAQAKVVMEIETALAKASLTRVDRRDPYKLFHKMTRAELLKLTPDFDWESYWKAIGLASPAEVNVSEPEFYKEVEHLLTTRPVADWKSYLRWHLVNATAPYLSSAFVQADFEFNRKYLRGVDAMQPRWKRCVRYVDEELGEAMGQVFAEKTFTPETKERALVMVKQVERAMETDLNQLNWMGPETKRQALAKLRTLVNKIGYPDKWRDYSSVSIVRSDFLGNVSRTGVFEFRRQLQKIGRPVDRTEWQMTPPTVNAYYDGQMNDINFPAGVLQPPLYDPKMDDAPNYGNTGAIIGHELTHAFDDEGRQFDDKGNLRDWWTEKDATAFNQRAACVIKQYSSYTVVDDIKINSKLTLGEDVADLGGTLLAYMAWKEATKGKALSRVEGFTPDQRFFIGMAQWACGDERPENKRVNAITNPHSPNEYRINGVVSNMPEFAHAFSCKAGQPMVRADACRVW
jgi:endothelin-converting enzyme/putative endopeptidase